jgi:rhodanese-related sulfurtransferase
MAPDDVQRVSPDEARRRAQAGQALLVCAYEDEDKCRAMNLAGAITLRQFRERLASVPRDREVIFYCA